MRADKTERTLMEGLKKADRVTQYKADIESYKKFIKEQRPDLKRADLEKVKRSAQDFADWMREKGQSEYTIAHRLTGLATALGTTKDKLPCETIHRGQPQKGREGSKTVVNDLNRPVRELNACVGIRRAELGDLRGRDLLEKDGRLYVVVEKGKGGKRQEQLILEKDEEKVRSFFEGKGADEYIFSKAQMEACEHANLHELRREHAQDCYKYYEELLNTPYKREKMKDLLEARFNANPKKKGKFERWRMDTIYHCRGAVRQEMFEAGRPTDYDYLSIMAVSVLHLAHYRADVAVKNYMK